MDFSIIETEIQGVKVLEYDSFSDERGKVWSTYIENKIENKIGKRFTHDKFSLSYKDVIRGIHFDQHTYKLVTAIYGEVDQVVVDMRKDSDTYRKFLMFELNKSAMRSILLPPMIGNAFRVRSEQAIYHYKLSYDGEYVDVDKQYTVKWDDESIGIPWDIKNPILSSRDK
tara:strand:- start:2729 stop:3238 length:510 start_codon:yes stop_codon:yes gene_type:complete